MASNSIAIIIPCYNEELRLQQDKFIDYANQNPQIDLCLVNDGSTDDTYALLEKIAQQSIGNISTYNITHNVGKAEAIRQTMNVLLTRTQYLHIGFIDADLSAPLSEINALYRIALEKKVKVVAGARIKLVGKIIHRNPLRHYLGRIFATYYDSLLKLRNYDTQCGLKIFERNIAQKIFDTSFVSNWFFDIELFVRARNILGYEQYNLQIIEEPLSEWREVKGSKLTIKDFMLAPYEVLKIYYKYKV